MAASRRRRSAICPWRDSDRFERLLALPDPDLQDMILHPGLAPAGEFADLIAAVRAFNGLEDPKP